VEVVAGNSVHKGLPSSLNGAAYTLGEEGSLGIV
jgi:hypothetical protein